jgi:hypothetical protein
VTIFLGSAGAGFVLFLLLARRRWNQRNSKDLGTMSQQWLAEYNAQHP